MAARASPSSKGWIHTVESPREKFYFFCGPRFVWDSLPVGSRVIEGPPPLPPLEDWEGAIEQAIENPLGDAEPLSKQLRPGMKVTIAFDDISLPLPPMKTPDLRERIITILLKKLGAAGIDDIHLIVAIGLHRKMTPREIRRAVGRKIFDEFYPKGRLYNHDAEDRENLVKFGETENGEFVDLNRRAVESDLLLYVNICLTTMDGGFKSLHTGLASYDSIKHHHNPETLYGSLSYMDPPRSELHHRLGRMGQLLKEHLKHFTIETAINTDTFDPLFTYLRKNEPDYNFFDRANLFLSRKALDLLPLSADRLIFRQVTSPYGLIAVHAGRTAEVHEKTLEALHRQQLMKVKGQSDILVMGVPFIGPYCVNSITNPILAMSLAPGYLFNFYRGGRPLVREGGAIILLHPLEWKFDPRFHPSYIQFFDEVLAETRDPYAMHEKYEESYARDERYIDLYRNHNAYHGSHPFFMWYWTAPAMKHCPHIYFVNPRSPAAAERMGCKHAPTLAAAIKMARSDLGKPDATVTSFRVPPIAMCEVGE